ncbi:putative GTPase, involved in coordination of cell cycle [Buchnera aphidicola (Cinara tujafilina)]|uniref:Probable GTP-binding protein EngB n=1 Tax=Buchnera aphidicola (Cinara tujafilina) TaxID=261317 RepID=F7WZI8_9GAMM|nr:ribosome biogenesis GTP-binding protein YihA/YsxC [Buchnera aphidicola]AEH39855.1 putative GTPase, involved in coordination of cell cycle [Buchnera aphidicola (Cinara tujafilina)]
MKKLLYHKTFFLKSSLYPNEWIDCIGSEIALLGYSNVGKSSIINALTNQKKLAYISKTPGRTRLINFFEVIPNFRIVDLPGYGYSKISYKYNSLIKDNLLYYIQNRSCLKGVLLLSDIRFPLKVLDIYILKYIIKRSLFLMIILTKSDKIQESIIIKNINIQIKIKKLRIFSDIIICSSLKKVGILQIQKKFLYGGKKLIKNYKFYFTFPQFFPVFIETCKGIFKLTQFSIKFLISNIIFCFFLFEFQKLIHHVFA